jgi:hypothetical protein
MLSCLPLPGPSDWLNDVRSNMDMSDNDVRVAVRLRLGLPLSELQVPEWPSSVHPLEILVHGTSDLNIVLNLPISLFCWMGTADTWSIYTS